MSAAKVTSGLHFFPPCNTSHCMELAPTMWPPAFGRVGFCLSRHLLPGATELELCYIWHVQQLV
jgi:hypothetical protein